MSIEQIQLDIVAKELEQLSEIDFSVMVPDETIQLNESTSITSNGENGYIVHFRTFRQRLKIRVLIHRTKLIRIEVERIKNPEQILLVLIGEEKIFVNGKWFARETFAETAFQLDTIGAEKFTLSTIASILTKEGILS